MDEEYCYICGKYHDLDDRNSWECEKPKDTRKLSLQLVNLCIGRLIREGVISVNVYDNYVTVWYDEREADGAYKNDTYVMTKEVETTIKSIKFK